MMTFLRQSLWVLALILDSLTGFTQSTRDLRPEPADTSLAYIPSSDGLPMEDDFSPGLFFFALLGLMLMVISAVVALVLAVLVLLLLAVLVAWGMVTASVLVGMYQKSFEKGIMTFWVLAFGVLSALCGMALWLLVAWLSDSFSYQTALWVGGLTGLSGGLGVGILSFKALRWLISFLIEKLRHKF